jgi:hypothetical protein
MKAVAMGALQVSRKTEKGRAAGHAIRQGQSQMPLAVLPKPATRGGATLPLTMVTPGYREEGTVESTEVDPTEVQPTPEPEKMVAGTPPWLLTAD